MISSFKEKLFFRFICKILILFFFLFNNLPSIFSQTNIKVTTARDGIAALNAGQNHGIVSGAKYQLHRQTAGGVMVVGIVRVERVLPERAGIRLIEARNASTILEGDFLGPRVENNMSDLFEMPSDGVQAQSRSYTPAQQGDTYVQGIMDGQNDAKGDVLWLLAGFGCGLLGVAAAYFTTPNPKMNRLVGKSQEYVMGYTEGYQNKAKGANVNNALAGWCGLGVLLSLLLIISADNLYY